MQAPLVPELWSAAPFPHPVNSKPSVRPPTSSTWRWPLCTGPGIPQDTKNGLLGIWDMELVSTRGCDMCNGGALCVPVLSLEVGTVACTLHSVCTLRYCCVWQITEGDG